MRERLRGRRGPARAPAAHHRRLHPLRGDLPQRRPHASPASCCVPTGKGPFPAVVLNHGYIEPSIYVTGQGLSREQDYLARAGFVVLHTDYRGHAASDPATPLSRETRLGYTRDTINAVQSLKKERVRRPRPGGDARPVDGRRRHPQRARRQAGPGQGGGRLRLGQLAASSTTSTAGRVAERPEAAAAAYFAEFGTPREEPGFYRGPVGAHVLRPDHRAPVLLHHGTLDDSCPIAWSRTTQRLLRQAGVRLPPRRLPTASSTRSARSGRSRCERTVALPAPRAACLTGLSGLSARGRPGYRGGQSHAGEAA